MTDEIVHDILCEECSNFLNVERRDESSLLRSKQDYGLGQLLGSSNRGCHLCSLILADVAKDNEDLLADVVQNGTVRVHAVLRDYRHIATNPYSICIDIDRPDGMSVTVSILDIVSCSPIQETSTTS